MKVGSDGLGVSALSTVFSGSDEEERCLAGLVSAEGLDDTRLRLLMQDYYAACMDETPAFYSLSVRDGDQVVALMPLVMEDRHLSYFGMPAAMALAARLDTAGQCEACDTACRAAVDHCIESGMGLTIARAGHRAPEAALRDWEVKLLQAGGRQVAHYRAHVALDGGETGIRRQMRKSYRSLVNWGRREMQLAFLDSANADAHLFDAFRRFHLQVAGRVTRPLASWTAMFDLLKRGKAILGLGYLDGELVAATYLFCHGGLALYGTGVYDRDRFDKPISHWPLFATMQRAGESGARLCDLGEVFLDPCASTKEQNIAFFKKGFTDTVIDEAYWLLEQRNRREKNE